jgi:hypothetical protein
MSRASSKSARPSKAKAASRFNAAEWARTYAGPRRSVCTTCEIPRAVALIREALVPIREDGVRFPGFSPFRRMLAEQCGYTLGDNALANHLRKCEGYAP